MGGIAGGSSWPAEGQKVSQGHEAGVRQFGGESSK